VARFVVVRTVYAQQVEKDSHASPTGGQAAMKKLLVITGPQGSGNHLFSKLFALHPDVLGWKELNRTYWMGREQEPFHKFWLNPELWLTEDFGDYKYAVSGIPVPYVQNGVTQNPHFDDFINCAQKAGWEVKVIIIGRDVNILKMQHTRLRGKVTFQAMLDVLEHELEKYNPTFISHELVYLYGPKYLKALSRDLDFPIAWNDPMIYEILKEDSNEKYIKYVEDHWLDKEVTKSLASTAKPGTEWYNRGK